MASIEERATIVVVIPMASMRLLKRWVLVGLLFGGLVRAADIDFARDIQPILSEYCYQCHGPSTTGRKGGLRLDVQEGALGAGKSGKTAIVPGRAEQSEVIRRLGSSDPEEVMPPPETGKKPGPEQVRLLKRWIQEGGRGGDRLQRQGGYQAGQQHPGPGRSHPDRGPEGHEARDGGGDAQGHGGDVPSERKGRGAGGQGQGSGLKAAPSSRREARRQ